MSGRRWLGWLPGVAVLVGIAVLHAGLAAAKYDPFLIPHDRFREQVKRVAIRPFRFPPDLPDSESLSRHAVELVANQLEKLGFEVIDPVEFEGRWRDYSETVGGVFDPTSGVADAEKARVVFEYTLRDLVDAHAVDAVVRISYFLRAAEVSSDGVYLWAAGSSLVWEGEWIPARTGAAAYWPQLVHAAWMGIEFRDAAGQRIFDVAYPMGWTRIYMRRGFEEIPIEERVTEEAIGEALDHCLVETTK